VWENVGAIRAVAGRDTQLLAVIKADGYGHGAELMAPVLADAGVAWLGVGDVEEGVRVRRALSGLRGGRGAGDGSKDEVRLLVMCGMEPGDAAAMMEHGLTPVVWTREHLRAMEDAAGAVVDPTRPGDKTAGTDGAPRVVEGRDDSRVRVHVEIDSGMARQGARPGKELAGFLEELRRCGHVRCEGVFSHLSSSEVRRAEQTKRQLGEFGRALEQVRASGVRPEWVHLANSSAVDVGETAEWMRQQARAMSARVLVRPGIAVYGYCLAIEGGSGALSRSGELAARLKPVMTWKTRVIGLREIQAGQTVGYGATFVAQRAMKLALLPVGYADGFRREASSGIGGGWVMIRGERAAVVGRVSMNLMVVDVSSIDGVKVGDEVVLLGEGVTAEDHARWCGTIAYEILCGIRGSAKLV
jgi:alanine racemase